MNNLVKFTAAFATAFPSPTIRHPHTPSRMRLSSSYQPFWGGNPLDRSQQADLDSVLSSTSDSAVLLLHQDRVLCDKVDGAISVAWQPLAALMAARTVTMDSTNTIVLGRHTTTNKWCGCWPDYRALCFLHAGVRKSHHLCLPMLIQAPGCGLQSGV